MTTDHAPWWLRSATVLLAVPLLVTGGWAVLAPRGFYDSFPGWGSPLVAAAPPFNAHLVTDTGTGFLAVGVVLALAAYVGAAPGLRLALAGLAAFTLPHLVYHAANPASALSGAENALNVAVLGAELALPLVLLVLSRRPALRVDRRSEEIA